MLPTETKIAKLSGLLALALATGGCTVEKVTINPPRVFGSYELGVTTGPADAGGDQNRPYRPRLAAEDR